MMRLKQLVPGVHGFLSQFIGVTDEVYRNAATCGLRRNPIVAENFEVATLCLRQIRALQNWQDGPAVVALRAIAPVADARVAEVQKGETGWISDREIQWDTGSVHGLHSLVEGVDYIAATCGDCQACALDRVPKDELVVVTCDRAWEDIELDEKLERLRKIGGTCIPLLDCLQCQADCRLDQQKLIIALRKVIGPTAVCDGVVEAEKVIAAERCDIICCQGTRLAEYQECWIPEVVWREWPSGKQMWEP